MTPRDTFALVVGILPRSRIKCLLLSFVKGWHIAPSTTIGSCLFLGVAELVLDEGAVLCSGSIYRNLQSVRVGKNSVIGRWNTFSAAPEVVATLASPESASLSIGVESAITNRHYVDCTGGISIGNFSTVAGVRSTFLSHSIDFQHGQQRGVGISVGDYSFVASNCSLMAGATLPARSILGMGAVLRPGAKGESLLYGGVPAQPLGEAKGAYFSRSVGRIGPT